jgi:hypothetical protein
MRIKFQTVSDIIDRMYDQDTPTTDAAIHQQVQAISDFIQSCGWDEDEFWEKWMSQTEGLDSALAETYLPRHATDLN